MKPNRCRFLGTWFVRIALCLLFLGTAIPGANAGSFNFSVGFSSGGWRHHRYVHRRHRHPGRWRGRHSPKRRWHRRPRYRKHKRIRPSIGGVVSWLPRSHRTAVSGGTRYFLFDDLHFRRHSAGYPAVSPPPAAYRPLTPPKPTPNLAESRPRASRHPPEKSHIRVLVEVLNVRSGPGRDHPVIGQVRQGRRLKVADRAPGWSHVQLPDGRHGWVMNRFTTALARKGRG